MTEEKIKKEKNNEQAKVGVYICYCGGNISDHVDVEAVRESVANLPGVAAARTNMFMCSDPGQEMIMEDLKNGTVNRVVVASCAPSLHETTFRNTLIRAGMNPYIYDHANIREHVSWVHHGQAATDKATRLISAAAAKAEQLVPLEPIRVDAKAHATIIGGGIAGLRAAKDLAERGINVVLIEKSPFLGGQLARLDRVAPTGEKAHDLIEELVGQVLADPAISVHTCTTVAKFEGYVGSFKLGLKKQPPPPIDADVGPAPSALDNLEPGAYVPFAGIYPNSVPTAEEELTIETGVIVLATGFKTYGPRRGEYGFKEFEQVITLPELDSVTGHGRKRRRPVGGQRQGNPKCGHDSLCRQPANPRHPPRRRIGSFKRVLFPYLLFGHAQCGQHYPRSVSRDKRVRVLPGYPYVRPRAGGTLQPGIPKQGGVSAVRSRRISAGH